MAVKTVQLSKRNIADWVVQSQYGIKPFHRPMLRRVNKFDDRAGINKLARRALHEGLYYLRGWPVCWDIRSKRVVLFDVLEPTPEISPNIGVGEVVFVQHESANNIAQIV